MAMPGGSLSLWKILGVFGVILMVLIWLGPVFVGIGKAVRTGEWSEVLKTTGGRVFTIDAILQEETNYLLDENNEDQMYTKIFHFAHALTLVFMLFFVAYLLFKFFSWLIGIHAFSPSSDILIIVGIILLFLLIEFFYAYFVLGQTIIPLKDGVVYFFRKLPTIANRMLS